MANTLRNRKSNTPNNFGMRTPFRLRKLFMDNFYSKVNFYNLSLNPNAISILGNISHSKAMKLNIYDYMYSNLNAGELARQNNYIHINPRNPGMGHLIGEKNLYCFYNHELCMNSDPNVIDILEKQLEKGKDLTWDKLSSNPGAIRLLEKRKNRINCNEICKNENAIHLIKEYAEKNGYSVYMLRNLSCNSNPEAIKILEEHLDKVDWDNLSLNPGAINLLEKHLDKINWTNLSANPSAIRLLEKYPDKINWKMLSKNPSAYDMLQKNPKKIDWTEVWINPSIFIYDYEEMTASRPYHEELLHIKNIKT